MRIVSGISVLIAESLALIAFAFFQASASGAAAESANWPSWRGPANNGTAAQGVYPVRWDAINVLWKAPLPGKGSSTPIVWDQRIFLTAPSEKLDAVLAFDWDGKQVWQTTLGPERAGKHKNGSSCNSSPVTDGKTVFVYFFSGALAALDMKGKTLWQTNLVAAYGPETLYWDKGNSPVLTKEDVVVARMHHGESWVAAFNKATGQMHWKTPRNFETAEEGDHAYSTPVVIEHQGREALLVWGGEHMTAYDTSEGKLLWSCGDFNPKAVANWPSIATPVVVGDIAVVPCGRPNPGQSRLYGIRLGGAGDVTATHRVWKREDTGTFVPTPAEYNGRIYMVRDRGEVECVDPATGKTLWQDALPKDSSNYYASPLIAGGRLYAAREDGVVYVSNVEGKFEVLSENNMDERVIASPVGVSGRLLIRGDNHLFCIAGDSSRDSSKDKK